MKIFESHAHYSDEKFDNDRDEMMNNLKNENIEYVIEVGSNIDDSNKAVNLAKEYDFVYAAVGIHPENVNDIEDDDFDKLEELLKNKTDNKIVAIGEIGLDYHFTKENEKKQKEVFIKQIELAKKYDLPIIVHSRDACSDTLEIIKKAHELNVTGVIHCFPEGVEIAREYQKMNYYIGIGGVVTFKNAKHLLDVVKEMPIEMILLETDSPYLAPEPHRGERNDSRNLVYVAKKISELKGIDYDDVIKFTNLNAKKLFSIEK